MKESWSSWPTQEHAFTRACRLEAAHNVASFWLITAMHLGLLRALLVRTRHSRPLRIRRCARRVLVKVLVENCGVFFFFGSFLPLFISNKASRIQLWSAFSYLTIKVITRSRPTPLCHINVRQAVFVFEEQISQSRDSLDDGRQGGRLTLRAIENSIISH